ncbi:hypothetical protein Tsp_06797 [Trichinella spiralis]|uniref:hypothetical protein n=1 Tax=Trichinella spiralis TaxID=6334 RepID=UPI0001EFC5E6|nr:hypothetical protein Tsp_06797 [Trichinella spiralis]
MSSHEACTVGNPCSHGHKGQTIPLVHLWIILSHEARIDANQCSPGVSIPFSSRPSVPLLFTNCKKEFDIMTGMKYVSQHFVLDSNGLRHQKICLIAADGTLKLRFLRFCFSLSRKKNCFVFKVLVRNCEDDSRILNDPHRITRERKVLVRSIKVSRVEADIKRLRTGKWTAVR